MSDLRRNILGNFVKLLDSKGVSRKQFCEETGYSQQALSNFFTGKTKLPRVDFIKAVLRFEPKTSMLWFIFDQGEMFINGEIQILKIEDLKNDGPLIDSLQKTINILLEENKDLKRKLGK